MLNNNILKENSIEAIRSKGFDKKGLLRVDNVMMDIKKIEIDDDYPEYVAIETLITFHGEQWSVSLIIPTKSSKAMFKTAVKI